MAVDTTIAGLREESGNLGMDADRDEGSSRTFMEERFMTGG
jgi:hypothetical protein